MLAALPPPSSEQFIFNNPNNWGPTAHGATTAEAVNGRTNGRQPPANGEIHDTIVAADVVPEEPILHTLGTIARWVRDGFKKQPVVIKCLLLLPLVVLAMHLLPVLMVALVPLAIIFGLAYGAYRLAWTLVGGFFREPKRPVQAQVLKPPRERIAELLGSLLGSTLAAAATCGVMVFVEILRDRAVDFPQPEQFAWLLLVSVAGAWAALIQSKVWDGTPGDRTTRRFVSMIIGMGIGTVAYGLSELLMVKLPAAAGYPQPPGYRLPSGFYAIDGRPLWMAYVACFGTLFLLIRWWRQADRLRSKRLSLKRLIVSVAIAGVAAWLWQFPHPGYRWPPRQYRYRCSWPAPGCIRIGECETQTRICAFSAAGKVAG